MDMEGSSPFENPCQPLALRGMHGTAWDGRESKGLVLGQSANLLPDAGGWGLSSLMLA